MLACLANSGKTESSLCTPAVTLAQVKINVTTDREKESVYISKKDKKEEEICWIFSTVSILTEC